MIATPPEMPQVAFRASAVVEERPDEPLGPVKFTIDDAIAMVRAEIVPEDSTIELLDGALVYVDRTAVGQEGAVESAGLTSSSPSSARSASGSTTVTDICERRARLSAAIRTRRSQTA